MPVLTDEQHQELLDKAKKAEQKAQASEEKLKKVNSSNEETLQQRNIFLTTSIVFLLLIVASVIIYFVQPQLLFSGQKVSDNEVVVNKDEIDEYEAEIATLKEQVEQSSNDDSKVSINGQQVSTFYAVQLGAFTNYNQSIVSPEYSLVKNIKEDGFTKYTIGVFSELQDARKLRQQVMKLGFEDAFIGEYNNGKRVDIVE